MAYALIWLPRVLAAAGLEVSVQPGWDKRGHGNMGQVRGIICHHTGEHIDGDLKPALGQLIHGRADPPLAGPLANLGLGQDGVYYIIAAGKAYHAGRGFWRGNTEGNAHFIGIEAENNGLGEVWPLKQMEAYAKGCAAIAKHCGFGPGMVIGHKEWALPRGRKIDPNFDMNAFRSRVEDYLKGMA